MRNMVCCLPESICKTESETKSCPNQMNPIQFDLKLSICPAVWGNSECSPEDLAERSSGIPGGCPV